MHFRTHAKPESRGQSGRWQSEYHDVMIDHDKHVGELLDLLDELGIADDTFVLYSTDNGPHMNTWPDGGTTPFRNEKNSNWEGAYRVPCMVRFPGKIPAGSVSNEIVSHLDWFPTFLAGGGRARHRREAEEGAQGGRQDLQGAPRRLQPPARTSPARSRRARARCSSTSRTTATSRPLRYDNWKLVFLEQKTEGTLRIWAEPFTALRGPIIFNLRIDPYEHAEITSNTYYDWMFHKALPARPGAALVGEFLATFKEFPPRQKAASFSLEEVVEKLTSVASGNG